MHALVLVHDVEEAAVLGACGALDARVAGEVADAGGLELAGALALGEGNAPVVGDRDSAAGVVLE